MMASILHAIKNAALKRLSPRYVRSLHTRLLQTDNIYMYSLHTFLVITASLLSQTVSSSPTILTVSSQATPPLNSTNLTDKQHKSKHLPFDILYPENILDLLTMGAIEENLGGHVSQSFLESLDAEEAFELAFDSGKALFEMEFRAIDGVGVNMGDGDRFSSIPRPDLNWPLGWGNIIPKRTTGPNSDSCISCHRFPLRDATGQTGRNTLKIDPQHIQKRPLVRQAPHLFGLGAQQRLAEEMTSALQKTRHEAKILSCQSQQPITIKLNSKTVSFGEIVVSCKHIDYTQLDGIDRDLIIKPFDWKGLTRSIRQFVRSAAHQELGMQAEELVGHIDGDFDGVNQELSVGDITALSVFNAAQARPVSKLELNQIIDQLPNNVIEQYNLPLSTSEITRIQNGQRLFESFLCAECHKPTLTLDSAIFFEPSQHPSYREDRFPAGPDILTPQRAIQFNLTQDHTDNLQLLANGQTLGDFDPIENHANNKSDGAIIRLYSDLKRHDMGDALAEVFDDGGLGTSVFLTEALWGVGSTRPYLHDGRADTLTQAIFFHAGESEYSRRLFDKASQQEKNDLLAFLDNLVLYLD